MAASLLALSPHLDDAVFACGELLAQAGHAVVVTVFAGRPPAGAAPTSWDRAAGFDSGDDVIGMRRDEDAKALALLGAQPVWLEFPDRQYAPSPALEALADRLDAVLRSERPRYVLFPLGLFHSDHKLVREAALCLMREPAFRQCGWLAYEDALYRRIPGEIDQALARLRESGLKRVSACFAANAEAGARKRAAVACYASQLRALATPGRLGHADTFEAENYWSLLPE